MRYLLIVPEEPSKKPLTWWFKIFSSIIRIIIPSEYPNLDNYWEQTKIWWLEIDRDGTPQREIGFDSQGQPIVIGPIGGNSGFLLDSCDNWKDSKEDSVEAAKKFEITWNTIYPMFKQFESKKS
jgi:hypothetical protein